MKIEFVDMFYVRMPVVKDIGDGSQDALLMRVRSGKYTGWGECEASPLVCIAAYVCPMSHSACKPVRDSVLGQTLDSPADITRIAALVRAQGLDIAQTAHTLSGIEIALWDLLGKAREEPVWRLLGYKTAYPKRPYASQLFGDTPDETFAKGRAALNAGFTAVKFGWGLYGTTSAAADRDQVAAAREAIGPDADLLIDAGTIWGDDAERAALRLPALEEFGARWLEEPFVGGALAAYRDLASRCKHVKLAGGEGAQDAHMAINLIEFGKIGFVQIDTGRIGGIASAKTVADHAAARRVTFVNHTFTTHLALSASLQPYAGVRESDICEYPIAASTLAESLTNERIELSSDGLVRLPDSPGLGIGPKASTIRQYLVDTEIKIAGNTLYRTPDL
jgi:L-alanine-DL-glutamate epimerase-like enolase superfamily enzyme